MEAVTAINLINTEKMLVSWDIGRRCNFDCTYCESTRHNTYSPPTDLVQLKNTFSFIKSYSNLYNRQVNLSFTGGEPTVNPNFWNLVHYVKENSNFEVSLTSNGTWHKKYLQHIINSMVGVTVSWHSEGPDLSKKRAIENILELHQSNVWTTVNVMMHVDHWNEAVDTYNYLKSNGVTAFPVLIGDGNLGFTNWFKDNDGVWRRTSHLYSNDQIEWFWKEKRIDKKVQEKILSGNSVGRSCCGGRCLKGKTDDTWKSINLVDNHFKGWYCSVNYYFLHIEEHTRKVFHHQTCQATFDGKGPIGSLDNTREILKNTKEYLTNPTPIICPNQRCGCGMCVPKAKHWEDFESMWNLLSAEKE